MERDSEEIQVGTIGPEEREQRRRIDALCDLLRKLLEDLGEPAELMQEPEGRGPVRRYGRGAMDIGQEAVNAMIGCDPIFKDERRAFPFTAGSLQEDLVRARIERYFENGLTAVLARVHAARIRNERQVAIKADLIEEEFRLALQGRWRADILRAAQQASADLLERVDRRKDQINGRRLGTRSINQDAQEKIQIAGRATAEGKRELARLRAENLYLSGQPLRPSDVVTDVSAGDPTGPAGQDGAAGQAGPRRRRPRVRRPLLGPRR